jgi:hypothetical protein
MPQLTIYLDKAAQVVIEAAAKRDGSSLSKWARKRLVDAASPAGWPEGYFDLFGSVTDETFSEPEELDSADDSGRDTL